MVKDRVQRRCNVKEKKSKTKNDKNIEELTNFDIGPSTAPCDEKKRFLMMQYPQALQYSNENMMTQYPNIVSPLQKNLDLAEAKRKLTFIEERESKIPIKNRSHQYCINAQDLIQNSFQNSAFAQCWTSNSNFLNSIGIVNETEKLDKDAQKALDQENEEAAALVEVDTWQDSNIEKDKLEDLSPLAAFCASLFRSTAKYDCAYHAEQHLYD